jgi:hypothetical protein
MVELERIEPCRKPETCLRHPRAGAYTRNAREQSPYAQCFGQPLNIRSCCLPFGRTIQVKPVVPVLAAATLASTLVFPLPTLAALSFVLFGAGPMVWTITSTTLRQSVIPGHMWPASRRCF